MAYDEASFQAGFVTGRYLWNTELIPKNNAQNNQNRQLNSEEEEENES